MTTQDIAVDLQERTILGKGLASLRKDGLVPAVIHDHGKESIHVMGDYIKLVKVYEQAGKHHPVVLKVGGKQHLALIKDVDFEPTKRRMRHVVLQAIRQDEEAEAEVPIVFEDVEIPAKKLNLMILRQLDHVEIKALPKDLPDEITVDPSTLAAVGDSLSVADLKVPVGVTILTEPEVQIAVVEMPRDQVAEADEAAASLAEDAIESGETAEEPEAEADKEASSDEEAAEPKSE